jgi:HTH-type transcriptional regulator/antitoxin HipB
MTTNIRAWRLQAGLTQVELARRVGVTQGSLSKFESGRSTPRVETLSRLAGALGVTLDALITSEHDSRQVY